MMIGTFEPARIRRQTSKPSIPGSPMSSTTRRTGCRRSSTTASSPDRSQTTRHPSCCSRYALTRRPMESSSSTSRRTPPVARALTAAEYAGSADGARADATAEPLPLLDDDLIGRTPDAVWRGSSHKDVPAGLDLAERDRLPAAGVDLRRRGGADRIDLRVGLLDREHLQRRVVARDDAASDAPLGAAQLGDVGAHEV